MNEAKKTAIFLGVAVVALIIAVLARPAAPERVAFDDSGERFFDEADPLSARSMEIMTFDDATADVQAFRVAHVDGVWSIPSHEDYPADAEEQLGRAAAAVLDLVKGPKVSDVAADHQLYGVVDPLSDEAVSGGAGMKVTVADAGGNAMAEFIIGKTVKDSEGLRYVRVPDRDRVYTAAVDTSPLSTKFEDWIEDDLLKLSPWEIRRIVINDYAVDEVQQRIVQGDVLAMTSEDGSTWSMEGLGEQETIRTTTVNDLKTAVDDLKIIDVHRKPAGLSAELRTPDALQLDTMAVSSLATRGFYIASNTLVSNQGETIVGMQSGIRYVLRFGEIALGERGESTLDPGEQEPAAPEPETEGSARYLFVMAEFDASLIPEPEYEARPELPAEPAGPEPGGAPGAEAGAEPGAGPGEEPGAPGEPGESPAPAPSAASEPDGQATDPAADAERQRIQAERDRITADNERTREEHEKKLADGRTLVTELNDRFADWYYVISDEVYRKIRLTRTDLVESAPEPPLGPSFEPAPAPAGG